MPPLEIIELIGERMSEHQIFNLWRDPRLNHHSLQEVWKNGDRGAVLAYIHLHVVHPLVRSSAA
ncbi:MAG TPA: hypothetical protein VGC58_01455 [Candidatus Paceibacterota bacterium]